MNVITSFAEKKRMKQVNYEKSVLREISLKILKERVKQYFGSFRFTQSLVMNRGIEEACYDVAIEAYLLGAGLSRFGLYGEEANRLSCAVGMRKSIVDTLYNFMLYWGDGDEGVMSESLYYLCEQYINSWWMDGFYKGEKRIKLRLH